jgi:hypothetical protein
MTTVPTAGGLRLTSLTPGAQIFAYFLYNKCDGRDFFCDPYGEAILENDKSQRSISLKKKFIFYKKQ